MTQPGDVPPVTHSFDQDYWDEIWQGDRSVAMGSSPANPHLVEEITGLAPGSALEAGCGAGAEAIWLAQQGWEVTAADVASAALAVAAERAAAGGVADRVRWVQADLSVWEPDTHYDLVTTHYAHPAMPQLEFYDRIASWVAPAGTLLIVGHLHQDTADGPEHGHAARRTATRTGATARGHPPRPRRPQPPSRSDWTRVGGRSSRRRSRTGPCPVPATPRSRSTTWSSEPSAADVSGDRSLRRLVPVVHGVGVHLLDQRNLLVEVVGGPVGRSAPARAPAPAPCPA